MSEYLCIYTRAEHSNAITLSKRCSVKIKQTPTITAYTLEARVVFHLFLSSYFIVVAVISLFLDDAVTTHSSLNQYRHKPTSGDCICTQTIKMFVEALHPRNIYCQIMTGTEWRSLLCCLWSGIVWPNMVLYGWYSLGLSSQVLLRPCLVCLLCLV